MATYKIIKFRKSGNNSTIQKGLSIDEAKRYCQREDTRGSNWFCGFTKES
jgi:hypothetical protein|tara:strand:- start:375 stop:524 length:150 start_codon:yes stop_codon:yes gene_type:complete